MLLLVVAFGVIFAVFATQNTGIISLNFGTLALSGIPIYLAILIPVVVALLLAFFLHFLRDLSQKLTINEQKDEIKNLKNELAEVTKDAHKYQLETTKLKSENGEPEDENSI